MSKACIVDLSKCIGCRACQVACKQSSELAAEKTRFHGTGGGYENPPVLSSKTYTRISFHELLDPDGDLDRMVHVKHNCMHCIDPACVSACPVHALEKTDDGPVVYHPNRCMGCRYCMVACPFNIPTLEWERLAPTIKKCDFCADRISEPPAREGVVNGQVLSGESLERFQEGQQTPACIKACPTEALKFGERDDLVTVARDRIRMHNGRSDATWKYEDHIYGEREAGGTAWMYISPVSFERLDLPMNLPDKGYSELTRAALEFVPYGVLGIGIVLSGSYWFTRRRAEVAAGQAVGQTEREE